MDTRNPFSSLSRMVALHNISNLCPSVDMVFINEVVLQVIFFIINVKTLFFPEGTMQGDSLPMPGILTSIKND